MPEAATPTASPTLGRGAGRGPVRRSRINNGPGRILTALYGVFAIAASGRSAVQLAMDAEKAPLAYGLSAVAAAVYVVAAVCMVIGDRARRVAIVACTFELVGVLGIGTLSFVRPELFPDRTVWSHFGQGYGFLPLVLPIVALVWLIRRRPVTPDAAPPATP